MIAYSRDPKGSEQPPRARRWRDSVSHYDVLKSLILFVVLGSLGGIFLYTPALSTPAVLGIILTIMLSPLVSSLERTGMERIPAIIIVFGAVAVGLTFLGIWATTSLGGEWESLRNRLPTYLIETESRLREWEAQYFSKLPLLKEAHPAQALVEWGQSSSRWFITAGPKILGDTLTYILLVPIFCFILLKDGQLLRRRFFQLVPNRFFESAFMVSQKISSAFSAYVRARLIEAFIVGLMITLGLTFIGAPYTVVLGIIGGVASIIPYIGIFVGPITGLVVIGLDPTHSDKVWLATLVYAIAVLVDFVFLVPIFLAKAMKLHPLALIAAVILGQQYYGFIGMLISIPIATAIKVFFQEIYAEVYEHYRTREDAPLSSIIE